MNSLLVICLNVRTSPKAPLPMTLTVLKSSRLSLVRRNRKYVDSFFPNWVSCLFFRSSGIVRSFCNRLSSSTRLEKHQKTCSSSFSKETRRVFRSTAASTATL